jgi:hypothetical protein
LPTKKVKHTQPLFGEASALGYLIMVPGASALIRQNGVACSVYSNSTGTSMTNPVPTGVPTGTAGVDVNGTLLVFLDPGSGYDAQVTVGAAVSTLTIPDIHVDVDDVTSATTTRQANQQAGNYTLVLADAGKAVEGNSASALSFTVPPNSSVAYPVGTIIEVPQVGAGAVTLVAGSGVTITGDTVTPGQGGSLLLRKTGTNTWWSSIASVRSGTFAESQEAGVPMVAEERAFNKVAAVPTTTDDTAGLLDLITDNPNAVLRSGTYKVDPNVLIGADRGYITGAGLNKTIIQRRGAAAGWILKPGSWDSRLDGITIDGMNTAGTTGVLCDNDNPQNQADWGSLHIRNCPEAGLKLYMPDGGSGHYYNHFGRVITDGCGKGVWLHTDTPAPVPIVNANLFDYIRANTCTEGLVIDGADGNGVSFLEAEVCTTGIVASWCEAFIISAGWLEANTKNFDIADSPFVLGFWYGGNTDEGFPAGADYVESTNRSDLITFKAGGHFKALAGRWFYDNLEPRGSGIIKAKVVNPDADNTRTLGEEGLRWADVRTNAVHASGDAWSSRIITDAVSGSGQAGWRFGNFVAGAVTVDTANYIEVEIGGVLRRLIVAE